MKWNDKTIEKAIYDVMELAEIKTMPTESIIREFTGSYALSKAIQTHGGIKTWASKLNLPLSNCSTRTGESFEEQCFRTLVLLGYNCQQTSPNYPYDILADYVKIDVKVSHLYESAQNNNYYSFNIGKTKPTCDIYVAYCVDSKKKILRTYVIPSSVIQGQTQLAIGKINSKYDIFLNNWGIIKKYNDFMGSGWINE